MPVMLYYSYTSDVFTFHSIVAMLLCVFVRSLIAFVCQEIKGLLIYLLRCDELIDYEFTS